MNITKISSMLAVSALLAVPAVAAGAAAAGAAAAGAAAGGTITGSSPAAGSTIGGVKTIGVKYTVVAPAEINIVSGTSHDLEKGAGISAIKLPAHVSANFKVSSTNGALKHSDAKVTKTIPYTIQVDNKPQVDAASYVTTANKIDAATISSANTSATSVQLTFTAGVVPTDAKPGAYSDNVVLELLSI